MTELLQIKAVKPTQKQILEEACRLFFLYGYHGASLQQIADACRIHKSSLFHHYKSKQQIVTALVCHLKRRAVDEVFIFISSDDSKSKENVREFLQAMKLFFINSPSGATPFYINAEMNDESDPMRQQFIDYQQIWLEAITRVLLHLHDKSDIAGLVNESFSMIQGALMLHRANRSIEPIEFTWKILEEKWVG